MVKRLFILLMLSMFLSSCSLWPFGKNKKEDKIDAIVDEVQMINQRLPSMEPEVLRVTGFGTINPNSRSLTPVQQKLIAMRASKLDAYRALAERVYGTQISGNTTVENLVVENDRFRTYVDTYILGAKVISQDEMGDGSYQTILEMVLDAGFRNCLTSDKQMRKNTQCASEMVHDLNSIGRASLYNQGIESNNSGLYFIE